MLCCCLISQKHVSFCNMEHLEIKRTCFLEIKVSKWYYVYDLRFPCFKFQPVFLLLVLALKFHHRFTNKFILYWGLVCFWICDVTYGKLGHSPKHTPCISGWKFPVILTVNPKFLQTCLWPMEVTSICHALGSAFSVGRCSHHGKGTDASSRVA